MCSKSFDVFRFTTKKCICLWGLWVYETFNACIYIGASSNWPGNQTAFLLAPNCSTSKRPNRRGHTGSADWNEQIRPGAQRRNFARLRHSQLTRKTKQYYCQTAPGQHLPWIIQHAHGALLTTKVNISVTNHRDHDWNEKNVGLKSRRRL